MSRAIIITGMHRSGTSLTGSLVQRAGIHIGEKLLAGDSANPRGYFEDPDFYEFHDHLLHERGQTYLHIDSDFTLDPTAADTQHARRLIGERFHRPLWGWKDPRTSLFLDFWNQLLPDARFVFVYRHPVEVLLSLLRRGEFRSHPSFMAALGAWHKYNSNILAFCSRYPDRSLLVHIDGVTTQPSRFFQLLQEKLQLDSRPDLETFGQIYHSNELQKTPFPPELTTTLAKLFPGLLELYRQINLRAELPDDEIRTDSTASPRFSPLAHFIESLAEPVSLPVKHSLLQLTLWLLAPEPMEGLISRFNQNIKEAQRLFDQLWLHSQHLSRLNTEQQQELESRLGQIAEQRQTLGQLSKQITEQGQQMDRQVQELERLNQLAAQQAQTLDNLHWLNLEQCQELERRTAQIDCLTAELNGIYGTHVGKALRSYRNLKERWNKVA
jgi:hypothetical protein